MNGEKKPLSLDEDENKPTIVILDVGGRKFKTYRDTLVCNSDFFKAKFNGEFAENEGEIFLDRNGELFGYLLEYMRCRALPEGLEKKVLRSIKRECEYFAMDEMEEEIEKMLKRKVIFKNKSYNSYELSQMSFDGETIEKIELKSNEHYHERWYILFKKEVDEGEMDQWTGSDRQVKLY